MRCLNLRKNSLINSRLVGAIAELKHTEYMVVCDLGLPLPEKANIIDLSLVPGLPGFMETLSAVLEELVVEGYIVASETAEKSPAMYDRIKAAMGAPPLQEVPHEEFKKLCFEAKTLVVTGETTPFANVILIGGVPF